MMLELLLQLRSCNELLKSPSNTFICLDSPELIWEGQQDVESIRRLAQLLVSCRKQGHDSALRLQSLY